MNKKANDAAIEQMKRLNKATEILRLICEEAEASEDATDFIRWMLYHSEKWLSQVEGSSVIK